MALTLDQNPCPIFPANLLSGDYSAGNWYVARVKSRREKSLASYLFRNTIGYYLPLIQRRQASKKRVRYSLVPVFPGYVFMHTDITGRFNALRTNHISKVIEVHDPETLMLELRMIHHALSTDTPVYPVEFVNIGQHVRVKSGPMKGIEGIVIRKGKKYRIVLTVTSIMQSISLEVEADTVVPLHASSPF